MKKTENMKKSSLSHAKPKNRVETHLSFENINLSFSSINDTVVYGTHCF